MGFLDFLSPQADVRANMHASWEFLLHLFSHNTISPTTGIIIDCSGSVMLMMFAMFSITVMFLSLQSGEHIILVGSSEIGNDLRIYMHSLSASKQYALKVVAIGLFIVVFGPQIINGTVWMAKGARTLMDSMQEQYETTKSSHGYQAICFAMLSLLILVSGISYNIGYQTGRSNCGANLIF